MKYRKRHALLLTIKATGVTEIYKNLKGIYKYHSPAEIGCHVDWLWKNKIDLCNPFENKKVKIQVIEIL